MLERRSSACPLTDQRAGFIAEALAAHQHMLASGEGYEAGEVHAWLETRVTDRQAAKPSAKPWRVISRGSGP